MIFYVIYGKLIMSLYDDEDLGAPPTEVAVGWSTGVKMMQSQLQVKKLAPPSMGPPKSNSSTNSINKGRTSSVLAPVIDLKSKKIIEESSQKFQRAERVSSNENCNVYF